MVLLALTHHCVLHELCKVVRFTNSKKTLVNALKDALSDLFRIMLLSDVVGLFNYNG